MNFVSLVFFIFLPVVTLLHWIIPSKFRWIVLLAASYFFYGFANPLLILLIAGTTLVSYLAALGIEKYPKRKRLFLAIAILLTLGTLFVFKYLDFALSLFVFAGLNLSFYPLNLILPVGISFYTFQTIGYVVDVYRGKAKAERHLGYFALFISFFPQLVAGPIEKAERLIPQLRGERKANFDDFSVGLSFFLMGFLKKVVLADFLSVYVNGVYGDLASKGGFEILLATFLFGLVIYGDFSGYSDIALGCAKWLGIDLTKNFDRPYLSSSLHEFWNRWHITLNDFLAEYVYIPLGGSKKGTFRKCLNILIVFLISGLWHGASLHFLLWGAVHGALMIIETLLLPVLSKLKMGETPKKVLGIIVTYLLINLCWIFFRAQSIGEVGLIFEKIFTSFASSFDASFFLGWNFVWLIGAIALLIATPKLPRITQEGDYSAIALYACLILLVGVSYFNNLQAGGESSFIYFQF